MNLELDAVPKEGLNPVFTSKMVPYSYDASHLFNAIGGIHGDSIQGISRTYATKGLSLL